MFDFKAITNLLDEIKAALPGFKKSAPELIARMERLEQSCFEGLALLKQIEMNTRKDV